MLALVFGAVVATGSVTGAWSEAQSVSGGRALADASDAADAADTASAAELSGLSPEEARRWVAGSGDRWAAYYDPQQYVGLEQQLAGEYVGVGLWVERIPGGAGGGAAGGGIAVTRVQAGAPADRAGIRVGDRLLSIDGQAVSALPVTEVVSRLRGVGSPKPDGSTVVLGVGGASGRGAVRRVTLRRQLLDADDVVVDHPAPGITRIDVTAFSQEVGDEVTAAVHQVAAEAGAGAGAAADTAAGSGTGGSAPGETTGEAPGDAPDAGPGTAGAPARAPARAPAWARAATRPPGPGAPRAPARRREGPRRAGRERRSGLWAATPQAQGSPGTRGPRRRRSPPEPPAPAPPAPRAPPPPPPPAPPPPPPSIPPASSSTCAATPAGCWPRPSRSPPPSWTAAPSAPTGRPPAAPR